MENAMKFTIQNVSIKYGLSYYPKDFYYIYNTKCFY